MALNGVITRAEWKEMKQDIHFDYQEDNHFTELKDTEIMQGRLQILGEIDGYVGKYFSEDWVRKNVLRMTEEDIKNEQKQIDKEASEAPDEEDPDAEEKEEPTPIAQTEAFEPPEEISAEEKELVERMTEFIDGALEED